MNKITTKHLVKTKTKVKKPPSRGPYGLVVWGVPKQLRLDFKGVCIRRGVRMRDQIISLMEGFVERAK